MVAFRVVLLTAMFVALAPRPGHGEAEQGERLPNTHALNREGDIASQLVAGVDAFLLKQIETSIDRRAKHWKRDFSSAEAYNRSIESNRERLKFIVGVRDPRIAFESPELVATVAHPSLLAKG